MDAISDWTRDGGNDKTNAGYVEYGIRFVVLTTCKVNGVTKMKNILIGQRTF